MNRALLIACFALSTIALALSLVPRGDPVLPPPPATTGVMPEELEMLQRRLDDVEDNQRDLFDRIQRLQRAGVATADLTFDGGAPAALQAEVARLREEVHGMVAGEAMNSPGGKAFLKEALKEVQAEEARARMEQRMAATAQRTEQQKEQWKKFIADAHLNYAQEQALTQALDAEQQKRDALMAEARAGTKDFRDVFRSTRELQRDTDKTMKATLDEAQQRQYEQLRREQRGSGGFGRQGGDGDPRGPGGGRRERQ
ncbi:MAG: hypothetical protein JNK82_28415 [Myxococcaceae bacterium]|nr:hypothetical protein [Myxococcaceae bacterium]